PVADVDELAPGQGVDQLGQEAAVAGAVDEAGADDDALGPVPAGPDPHHPFGVDLRVDVGVVAVAQRRRLVGAPVLAEPVDRQRAEVDEALDSGCGAGGQQRPGPFDVDPPGFVVVQPVADESGAVEHPGGARQCSGQSGGIGQVAVDQLDAGPGQGVGP